MNSFKHYGIVIAISLLPFLSIIFTDQMPHTHDGPVHLARIAAYYKAISEGQLLPRWAGELNYGYGLPLFNFMYHVPYLVAIVPLFLGFGLIFAFKFSLIFSYIFGGLCMFAFGKSFFKDTKKAFLLTFLYQFTPYHLIDLVVRGDFGEGFAFAFLPLVLLSIIHYSGAPSVKKFIAITLSTGLLILSHNSVSLMFFGIIILFCLFFVSTTRTRHMVGVALFLGLLATAFYWAPAVIERKFTYGDLFMKDMYKSHFAPIWYFFIPNFTNTEKLQIGGIAVSFGLLPAVAFFWGLWRWMRQKKERNEIVWFSLLVTLGSLFVMQPLSMFLWEKIAILRIFQFPWRFLAITTFSLSFLGTSILLKKNRATRVYVLLILLTILPTLVYWKPPLGVDKINEKEYWDYPLNTTYFGETDLVWSAGPASAYPKAPFEIIEGTGFIESPLKTGIKHTYTVIAQSEVRVIDHTQYFPGWRVYADKEKVPIEFQDQNWRGVITYHLKPGKHSVIVSFGESPIRMVSELISLFTVTSLLLVFFIFSFVLPQSRGRLITAQNIQNNTKGTKLK